MVTKLRYVLRYATNGGSTTYYTTVEEFVPAVGWVPQQSFTGGTILSVTGQARDYVEENYPENEPSPGP